MISPFGKVKHRRKLWIVFCGGLYAEHFPHEYLPSATGGNEQQE
jgi:hypothetical protein